jgi:cysteine desulfurase / selenocysteine lyase
VTGWASIRGEFPALERWTFLNTATFGQLPRRAVEAVAQHFAHRDELACMDFLAWFDEADQMRARLARLINAAPDDVAFTPNASSALAIVMNGLDWRPGDRALTLAGEFPNNLYAPSVMEQRGVTGVEANSWDEFLTSLQPPVRLVALSTVNYTSGFRVPLEGLAERVHQAGALLYLDGTQSVGALKFDVATAQPDVLAVHGYKWLLAPNGAGFLYVAPEVRRRLEPNVIGWRSHKEWRRVDSLHHGVPEFSASAEKYEGGMLSFPLLYAMDASVRMMLEIGPEAIEQRVIELAGAVKESVRRHGARLAADESPYYDSPIVAARFDGVDASRLAVALKERRVLVSARHGHLRVSPHFYNNEEDVARFDRALGELLGPR